MKITIIETSEKEELKIIDPESGVNWANDLLGNHGALPDYDDDTYHMSQADYDWWDDLITDYQAADDILSDIMSELNEDDQDLANKEIYEIDCDLADYHGMVNQFCDQYDAECKN